MKFYGLDISKRRVGVSIGHIYENNKIILPYKVIDSESFEKFIEKIRLTNKNIIFIIGLPNRRYENFVRVKHFTHKYRSILNPFYFQDEEFSTLSIENDFDKYSNKPNDDLAASVILENFFKNKTYEELMCLEKEQVLN
jgi:RNase H-fold protein (predicted Holliday junction resolvase)